MRENRVNGEAGQYVVRPHLEALHPDILMCGGKSATPPESISDCVHSTRMLLAQNFSESSSASVKQISSCKGVSLFCSLIQSVVGSTGKGVALGSPPKAGLSAAQGKDLLRKL